MPEAVEPTNVPRPEAAPETENVYRPVKRALLSVFNKDGIVDFASALSGEGVELISTGGTKTALEQAGLPVTGVEEVTRFPEMMDGRVKTLHPKIFAGLLADRYKGKHLRQIAEQGIEPIDLVCVNLYPFQAEVEKGSGPLEIIEKIDVGGPSMIRAAAKNFDSVASVVNPDRYWDVIKELRENGGLSPRLRVECMLDVFSETAEYDAAIRDWGRDNFDLLLSLKKEFEAEDAVETPVDRSVTDALTDQALGG
jgi:phosphoribosylaminoimidazolecarboxamide formyltransferase/IMP cyclohydrolase